MRCARTFGHEAIVGRALVLLGPLRAPHLAVAAPPLCALAGLPGDGHEQDAAAEQREGSSARKQRHRRARALLPRGRRESACCPTVTLRSQERLASGMISKAGIGLPHPSIHMPSSGGRPGKKGGRRHTTVDRHHRLFIGSALFICLQARLVQSIHEHNSLHTDAHVRSQLNTPS